MSNRTEEDPYCAAEQSQTGEQSQKKEVRCLCNRLLFVLNGNNIEIKCPKCKRVAVISTNGVKNLKFK